MTHNSVIETLDWLIEYWPDLVEARLPLTTKPLRQTRTVTREEQDLRDGQAAIERYFRNPLSWGESPAPVDVNILQVLLDVVVHADDLAAELGPATLCPILAPPGLGELDARPWLRYTLARLQELPEEWADWMADKVQRMYEQVARALAMKYDGQTIKVVCPWCLGRTPEQPIGGAYTWTVVTLPGDQIAIVCYGLCEPPAREVGTWWGGQPCWPISDWERLAKHVRAQGQPFPVIVVTHTSKSGKGEMVQAVPEALSEEDPEEARQRLVQQIEEDQKEGKTVGGRA